MIIIIIIVIIGLIVSVIITIVLEQVRMGTWHQSNSEEQLSRRQTCMPWVAPSCTCCQVGCPCLPVYICVSI